MEERAVTKEAAEKALPWLLAECFGRYWEQPDINDFFINGTFVDGAGEFWIRRGGTQEALLSRSLTHRAARDIATLAAHIRGQRFDAESPLLDCELPGGERLAAVMHPCTPDECPVLAIRRGSSELPTLEELEAQGLFQQVKALKETFQPHSPLLVYRKAGRIMELLAHAVTRGMSIAFVGAVGSGKTHDIKACVMAMPRDERTIFVGDVNEVPKNLPLQNYAVLLAGKHGAIPQSALIAQALRMGMKTLIPLEVRDGDAAWALYRALASGHRAITSWHAPSAAKAFHTLSAMMGESASGANIPEETRRQRLRELFDVVCHVERQANGTFRATEILLAEKLE